jgi:hypothetical protein
MRPTAIQVVREELRRRAPDFLILEGVVKSVDDVLTVCDVQTKGAWALLRHVKISKPIIGKVQAGDNCLVVLVGQHSYIIATYKPGVLTGLAG